jgi:hypothetical protein
VRHLRENGRRGCEGEDLLDMREPIAQCHVRDLVTYRRQVCLDIVGVRPSATNSLWRRLEAHASCVHGPTTTTDGHAHRSHARANVLDGRHEPSAFARDLLGFEYQSLGTVQTGSSGDTLDREP